MQPSHPKKHHSDSLITILILNLYTMEINLLAILDGVRPISFELKTHIPRILKHKVLKHGSRLLEAGMINDKIWFVQKGLLRGFTEHEGVDVTAWFRVEGEFAVSIPSFYDQIPSTEHIEAFEDTDVLYITYQELDFIYENYLEFNYHGRKLLTPYFVEADRQRAALKKMSGEARFDWLVQNKPFLLNRVPDKYLASYCGITPETYSKIKKERLYRGKLY